MSAERLPPARLFPRDLEVLERRARALAAGDAERVDGEADGASQLVLFRILGRPCALDAAAVERAVSRLHGAAPVPMAGGADRTVAFVEEQPVPVADLVGSVGGGERPARALAEGPALVLTTPAGPVAVAVEGPLDLREERLSGRTQGAAAEGSTGLRLAGRLADGTSVLDAAWLVDWAGRAARA